MMTLEASTQDHLEMLKERVFETYTRYPHFELLLDDICELSKDIKKNTHIVAMERTLLYGGFSLIAPFFQKGKFTSLDCSPASAEKRGAYNAKMLDDPRAIKINYSKRATLCSTGLESEVADIVIIPNLVHHVKDQRTLFNEATRILRPGGKLYVFEPTVRELHQIPDDYLRYTPYGLAAIMEENGLEVISSNTHGGPFSVIAYCWQQALQYFPEAERTEKAKWFYEQHMPELNRLDSSYTENKVKQHSAFPMSFSVTAIKPL